MIIETNFTSLNNFLWGAPSNFCEKNNVSQNNGAPVLTAEAPFAENRHLSFIKTYTLKEIISQSDKYLVSLSSKTYVFWRQID